MDTNEKLNILYDMTEQQQNAIAEAIQELKRQNERLGSTGGDLQKVVKASVTESMSGTANTAQSAINTALSPMLNSLNASTQAANSANERLNKTISRLGWQMALMAGGVIVAVIACTQLAVWWQRSELADIKENIASQDGLKRQIKVANCGGYPCVEIDTIAPTTWGDYRILKSVKFK